MILEYNYWPILSTSQNPPSFFHFFYEKNSYIKMHLPVFTKAPHTCSRKAEM